MFLDTKCWGISSSAGSSERVEDTDDLADIRVAVEYITSHFNILVNLLALLRGTGAL